MKNVMQLVRNLKIVVALYKKNSRHPNKITITEITPNLILGLKKFSINTLSVFFFILNEFKSSS